jgi:hypothetical protein
MRILDRVKRKLYGILVARVNHDMALRGIVTKQARNIFVDLKGQWQGS